MTKLNNGTTDIDNVVVSLNSTLGTDDVRTQTPERGRESIMAKIKNRAATKYLAATLLATAPVAMTSCDPTEVVEPIEEIKETNEERVARFHAEAEAEADRLGWSQGVKSLVAGTIDYHYFRQTEKGPILIRLSYQVDVNDFIAKIEADAAARGTYDPKTEGILYARASSLNGDGKQNFWNIPSSVIYKAKEDNKNQVSFAIGEYPTENPIGNTIGKNEGLSPFKEMQIYASYGNKNWENSNDIVVQPSKRGPLKELL